MKLVIQKEDIWDRLQVKSVWLGVARTPFFTITDEHMTIDAGGNQVLVERYMRYIISLLFQGNAIVHQSGKIEKYEEPSLLAPLGSYTVKWSDVQIAPAAMPQIPEGSYSLEDPIIVLEGGTNLYGNVNGNSINLTITYWDWNV